MDVDTKAPSQIDNSPAPILNGSQKNLDLSIDPWVYMVGLGYKF